MKVNNAKMIGRIVVAFFMTQVVTFTVTAISIGFTESFVFIWLRNHLIALVVGIPTCLLLSPQVEKLITILSTESSKNRIS